MLTARKFQCQAVQNFEKQGVNTMTGLFPVLYGKDVVIWMRGNSAGNRMDLLAFLENITVRQFCVNGAKISYKYIYWRNINFIKKAL